MRPSLRVLAAAVITALTLTASVAQAAPPAGPGKGSHVKGSHDKGGNGQAAKAAAGQKQLLKSIAKVDRALDRSLRSSRIGGLTPESQAALLANADTDRLALADIAAAAAAADASVDVRQARKDLKSVRTVNYVLVVNILRKAEKLLAEGSGDAAALAAVVDTARLVTASSTKADLRELRAALKTVKDDIDDDVTEDPAAA